MADERRILECFLKHRKDQKSMIFLYPILQLKSKCLPISTYLYLNVETLSNDRYLFALFHEDQEGYEEVKKELMTHSLWDFVLSENGYDLHVINFEKYFDYYDKIIAGDYANISTQAKMILSRADHPLAIIGMDPERFVEAYAREFQVDIEGIPRKVQFINKPDTANETYRISNELIELFLECRGELTPITDKTE